MCLPSKKLYRGASCLFCLKKKVSMSEHSPLFCWVGDMGALLAAFGQSVIHEKNS